MYPRRSSKSKPIRKISNAPIIKEKSASRKIEVMFMSNSELLLGLEGVCVGLIVEIVAVE